MIKELIILTETTRGHIFPSPASPGQRLIEYNSYIFVYQKEYYYKIN